MAVVPDTRLAKIEFYEAHARPGGPWEAHAVAIGLTPEAVAAMGTLTAEARVAYGQHLAALSAARAATDRFYDKVRAMHDGPGAGADIIRTIRNHARTLGDPGVYTLAQIPPPATPSTPPPPGTPFDFRTGLLQDGRLTLGWKCANPDGTQGTLYEVRRAIVGEGPEPGNEAFVFLGATGVKSFTDETLPAGAASVIYRVTAIRSTSRGRPAQFIVNFGVGGVGGVGGRVGVSERLGGHARAVMGTKSEAEGTVRPAA